MGTAVVLAVIAIMAAFAVRSVIKQKKTGKGGCGCGCESCAMSEVCHRGPLKNRADRSRAE